jgi:hypothetical protein
MLAITASLAMPLAGQTPNAPTAPEAVSRKRMIPRTPWGHPDFQGIWTTDAEVSVPLERQREFGQRAMLTDAEFADRVKLEQKLSRDDPNDRDPFRLGPVGDGPEHWFEWGKQPSRRTSLVVDPSDGRIPALTPEAQARTVDPRRVIGYGERAGSTLGGSFDGPEDLSLADRCVTRGLPTTWFPQVYNNGFQIVQSRDHIAILYERLHEARVIPLDGRPHATSSLRQWFGDSRGHFEGETLVVDVVNFSDKTSFRRAGAALHLVERYTRIDADTLRVEITIDDPTTWVRPWTVAVTGKKDAAYSMIYEYACHEGNYSLAHILSAARAHDEQTNAEAPRR